MSLRKQIDEFLASGMRGDTPLGPRWAMGYDRALRDVLRLMDKEAMPTGDASEADEPRIQRLERLLHEASQRRIAGWSELRLSDVARRGVRSTRTLQLEKALFEAVRSMPYTFIVEINGRTYILDNTRDYIHGPYEVHRP